MRDVKTRDVQISFHPRKNPLHIHERIRFLKLIRVLTILPPCTMVRLKRAIFIVIVAGDTFAEYYKRSDSYRVTHGDLCEDAINYLHGN